MKKIFLLPLIIVGLLASGMPAQAAPPQKPESTGSAEQQAEAKNIVSESTEFADQRSQTSTPFDFDEAIVNVKEHYASVGVNSLSAEHSRVSVYIVDLETDRVMWDRTMVITPAASRSQEGSGAVDIEVVDQGDVVYAGTLSSEGTLSSSGQYKEFTAKANSAEGDCTQGECSSTPTLPPGEVAPQGICEWAVGALCGTGGAAGCYGACLALGLVSGPGGLGCATVCGLISALGCTGATNAICS